VYCSPIEIYDTLQQRFLFMHVQAFATAAGPLNERGGP